MNSEWTILRDLTFKVSETVLNLRGRMWQMWNFDIIHVNETDGC